MAELNAMPIKEILAPRLGVQQKYLYPDRKIESCIPGCYLAASAVSEVALLLSNMELAQTSSFR